jgi:diguanylate cyclase (GGDEF)-like protein/PAS domain S-box-containing protein
MSEPIVIFNDMSSPVYNLVYIAFIAAMTVGMSVSLFFIGYVWQRRNIHGALPLIGILSAIVFWSFGYIIEYVNSAIETKLFAWNISYIGVMTLPVMLVLFAFQYTRQDGWIKPARVAALFVIPAITIILQWTKESNQLMYSNMHLIVDSPFLLVAKEYGPWFWVSIVYNYFLFITGIVVLATRLFRPPRLLVDQIVYIIIAAIAPTAANLIYIFHLLPISHADWTPSAFAVSGVCLALAISRHHFMDILPVARESAIEIMQEGFLVIDDKRRMVDFNKAMQEIVDLAPSELLGKPLPDTISKQLYEGRDPNNLQESKIELALDMKQKLHYFSVNVSPLKIDRKHAGGYVLVFHDFTERKLMEDAVKQIAYYDPLTGLPNRALFNDRAEIAIEEASRYKRKLALLVLDLDKFKNINDTYGHDAGDQVLQDMAVRISSAVRKIDTASRLGGDEFIVLLPEIPGEETAQVVSERIINGAARPFFCCGHEIKVTISVGIAVYPDDALELKALVKCSDTAMYYIKQNGRNGYTRYRPDMIEPAQLTSGI